MNMLFKIVILLAFVAFFVIQSGACEPEKTVSGVYSGTAPAVMNCKDGDESITDPLGDVELKFKVEQNDKDVVVKEVNVFNGDIELFGKATDHSFAAAWDNGDDLHVLIRAKDVKPENAHTLLVVTFQPQLSKSLNIGKLNNVKCQISVEGILNRK